jgi:uncharacterized OB-fold protein
MSWAEDEGYDGWDFDDFRDEWPWCNKCENVYHPHQEFCYSCLSTENKWKLGVL